MSVVPYQPGDDRSYDEQMRDALAKALEVHGTVINDLNQALNCILQMERALRMVGAPNPYEAVAQQLKAKYGMGKKPHDEWRDQANSLVEGKEEPLELVEGQSWCDDCQRHVSECLCP